MVLQKLNRLISVGNMLVHDENTLVFSPYKLVWITNRLVYVKDKLVHGVHRPVSRNGRLVFIPSKLVFGHDKPTLIMSKLDSDECRFMSFMSVRRRCPHVQSLSEALLLNVSQRNALVTHDGCSGHFGSSEVGGNRG